MFNNWIVVWDIPDERKKEADARATMMRNQDYYASVALETTQQIFGHPMMFNVKTGEIKRISP